MQTKSTRGGTRPSAGRPAMLDKTITRTMRLSDADYVKFKALGGVKWLRTAVNINA